MFMVRTTYPTVFLSIAIKIQLQFIYHTQQYMIDIRKEWQNLLTLLLLSFSLRTLLIPAYYSTDFDVHQNWLRITATLPLQQWYFNADSPWTLDYPPLFAYFQAFLSSLATLIDPSIVQTINHLHQTILFQRITVILSQIPLLIVLALIREQIDFTFLWTYFSFGFMLLDNIHFQYNTLMQSLFILAVYLVQKEKYYSAAFLFALLINIKHIYLYAAGAFFVFLLKNHVLCGHNQTSVVKRLSILGACVAVPFIISFLPFILIGGIAQIQQILTRLFPFQRGLIHQYWAPNVWAIYYFFDKCLFQFLKIFSIQPIISSGSKSLRILPQITPLLTMCIILFLSLPLYIKVFKKKIPFYRLVVVNGLLFFLFGFHVHQKAILPYIGLLFVFQQEKNKSSSINRYTFAAFFINLLNLLPLLINVNQKLLRIVLLLLCGAIWASVYGINSRLQRGILIMGILILYYHQIIHPFQSKALQFFPLMINSVFCAAFNTLWTAILYKNIIME